MAHLASIKRNPLDPKRRTNLLLVGSRVPYPLISGERLKNFHLVKHLARHFDLHLIFLSDRKDTSEAVAALAPYAKSLTIVYVSPWSQRLKALKALISRTPLQVAYFHSKRAQKAVDQLLPTMDFAVATLVRTARYLKGAKIPKVLDMADSIGLNYLNSIDKVSSPLWRLAYRLESSRLLTFERACVNEFDRTFLFNAEEVDFFQSGGRTRWIPHGTNETLFQRPLPPMRRQAVAFLGKMDYQPNVDAVLWFCNHVLPLLPQEMTFLVIGAYPSHAIRALPSLHPNVQVTGFVEDPYRLMEDCAAMVAPMQTGAGIQNKVLEAMAMGLPVVSTSRAAKPIIGALHGRDILVADAPDEMAARIKELLAGAGLRASIGGAARSLVARTFTWDAYEQAILNGIQEALHAHSR